MFRMRRAPSGARFFVRPARAHSCGCKTRHKLITASEAKRNRMRVTECGEEAWSIVREPMDRNCMELGRISPIQTNGLLRVRLAVLMNC